MTRFLSVLAGGLLYLGVAFCLASSSSAAEPAAANPKDAGNIVDLFDAIQKEQISVTVRPRDAREVRIEIKNNTDQPLQVKLPKTLAAMPVLTQIFGQPGNVGFGAPGGNLNGRGAQQPQALGVSTQPNAPRGRNGRGNNNNGLFSVPAEKVVRITMQSLCLEYGKRDPNPRLPYELKPLEAFTDSVAVRELLEYYGENECEKEVAQMAAWHLSNGMTWDSMKEATTLRAGGKIENIFNSQGIENAKKMVDQLPSRQKKSDQETISASPANPNQP